MQERKTLPLNWLKFFVGSICLILDFISKSWARTNLLESNTKALCPGLLQFNLVTNSGAAFSLGSGHGQIMTVLALIVTVVLITWIIREEKRFDCVNNLFGVGAGFLIGGALGNLLDRFLRGRVTDFIELLFIHFPIFNFADIFIDVGIGLLIISAFRNQLHKNQVNNQEQIKEQTANLNQQSS